MELSGVVIAMNEAAHIEVTLRSLAKVCDHLVVLDSHSTDNTVELARACGAIVHVEDYAGDGPQKNRVIELAPTDWILILDADERLDEAAVAAINSMKKASSFDKRICYRLRRKNHLASRWIRHCGWYPDEVTRLFHRQYHRYEGAIHATVLSRSYKSVPGHIMHAAFADYGELFGKANYYSTSTAVILVNKGRRVYFWTPVLHGFAAFIRSYMLRRGVLSGLDGLVIGVSCAVNSFLKYAKALDIQRHGMTADSLRWHEQLFGSVNGNNDQA